MTILNSVRSDLVDKNSLEGKFNPGEVALRRLLYRKNLHNRLIG
jgi:hypothetical protein